MLWIRGLQIPWFDRSNLFLRRISNPSGRLAVCGTASVVWDAWRGDERHIRRGGKLPILRQAFRRICNPSLKNDLTYLCSADLQSAAGRL